MKKLLMIGVALALAACATEREARLYPLNAPAVPGGVLSAAFNAQGVGHGSVVVDMPGNRMLTGEYSIVRGGVVGAFMADRGHGTASAYGDGISISCDFENDNLSGHGDGTCRTSRGATYRLQY
ncbi:MAG: hypothetical protein ACYDAE_19640 [Steroidobacteraceae bacterium]